MQYIIRPPRGIQAAINLPASKSISNRALIIHALTPGAPMPDNLSDCDDTRVLEDALRRQPETIDIGPAGTAMRFLTAYLASQPGQRVLTGSERMRHRPIGVLVDALRSLGADINYEGEDGFPPLRITGRQLAGGTIEIPGDVSSQFVTALLLVAPAMDNGLTVKLKGNIISRPYIDLTLHVMHQFGAKAEWTDIDTIHVPHQAYQPVSYAVENDWTAASYWYEAMALLGDSAASVSLNGLQDNSRQGDATVKYIFSLLGIRTAFSTPKEGNRQGVTLSYRKFHLPYMEYNFAGQPDLAQSVAATCAALGTRFRFTGLSSLRIKETDRLSALVAEMRKLGYQLQTTTDNELIWDGAQCQAAPTPVINTYNDHRMAMAFAPLAIKHPDLRIDAPDVVSKSYPQFWHELERAGFTITPC